MRGKTSRNRKKAAHGKAKMPHTMPHEKMMEQMPPGMEEAMPGPATKKAKAPKRKGKT